MSELLDKIALKLLGRPVTTMEGAKLFADELINIVRDYYGLNDSHGIYLGCAYETDIRADERERFVQIIAKRRLRLLSSEQCKSLIEAIKAE